MDTRTLMTIVIEYDDAATLPLRWTLYAGGATEPFLKANRSFKTREDAFQDAERLLRRLKKRYVRRLERRPP